MISFSISRLVLQLMACLLMLQVAITLASNLPIDADFKLNQETPESSDNGELSSMSKEEFRQTMARQLLLLQQAEADVMNRIQELEAEKRVLSQRKRSHYTSMCIFNVVSCYRKRR